MEFGGGRKRGRHEGASNGNGGFKKSKQEMENFPTGIGSKSKPCTKFFRNGKLLISESTVGLTTCRASLNSFRSGPINWHLKFRNMLSKLFSTGVTLLNECSFCTRAGYVVIRLCIAKEVTRVAKLVELNVIVTILKYCGSFSPFLFKT
ncbi:hypothetical protein WN944_009248 [Citrus x changshan-huyou]|uniref:Uncharacterized protein n=1 Tax=Citrus x changshan-huyou TaxID=2935761 RepID=A0AAP0MRF5_9ROSI